MFAERLKELRNKKGISQEDLAELLNVSRQSISKYEQGLSMPDYEKLALLVKYFETSFDYLLAENDVEQAKELIKLDAGNSKIAIISEIDGSLSTYYKFTLAKTFQPKPYHPHGTLMGVDSTTFWGESSRPLGWYRTIADAEKELRAIYQAIAQNQGSYTLRYSVKVKNKGWLDMQMVEE